MKVLNKREKVKTIAIFAAMVLLVLLIVVSIVVGWQSSNSEEPNEEESSENMGEVDLDDTDMYTYNEGKQDEKDDEIINESTPTEEDLEQLKEGEIWEELEDPLEDAELSEEDMFTDEGPPLYEELYSGDEIKVSQDATEAFVEIIYNIDGADPMKYYNEAKNLMSDELYERLEQEYNEGKMTWMYGLNREFESLEIYQPNSIDPEQEEGITWAARIQGKQSIHDGDKEGVTDVYIIRLKEIDGNYIIDDFAINFPT